MEESLILQLYKKDQTVFTTKELSLFFPKTPYNRLKRKLSYYVKTEKISRPRRGIYIKENFNPLELANKIYTPSYISLKQALKKAKEKIGKVPRNRLLQGWGELLDDNQKATVKNKLKEDLLFQIDLLLRL